MHSIQFWEKVFCVWFEKDATPDDDDAGKVCEIWTPALVSSFIILNKLHWEKNSLLYLKHNTSMELKYTI